MKRERVIIYSVIGAFVCSVFLIGYTNKSREDIETIKSEDVNYNLDFAEVDKQKMEIDDYWENTSMEEIKKSILSYIDDMMNSTMVKLEDFKKENNNSKVKLYENEIKRLNIILSNVKSAGTKIDLRRAMQVRHKNSVWIIRRAYYLCSLFLYAFFNETSPEFIEMILFFEFKIKCPNSLKPHTTPKIFSLFKVKEICLFNM